MKNDNIEVSVETKDSRPIRTFTHEGKTFIESKENAIYQIRVKNKTDKRIKAIIAVDSVSIVTGNPITDKPDETGYILNAYEEQVFKGYRVDQNQVAEFKFVKREASYATEKGEGGNNGVIAVRVFAEKERPNTDIWQKLYEMERNKPREKEYIPIRPWYWEDQWYPYHRPIWTSTPYWWETTYCKSTSDNVADLMGTGTASCAADSTMTLMNCSLNTEKIGKLVPDHQEAVDAFQHGSGWGDAVADKVKEVAFEVGRLLAELSIYYAPLAGLQALGINVTREKQVTFPEPFKREYASPPKGWHSGVK